MGDTCSAVPAKLMTYGSRGQQNDGDLKASGSKVSGAIQALLSSKPDPSVLPRLEDVGSELTSYAVKKQGVDQWVWDVGVAFLSAGERQISAQLGPVAAEHYDGSDLVTTDSSVIDSGLSVEAGFYTDQAKQLRQALDSGDWEKVQQIVASLSFMKDDPVMMAAFFNTLGPRYTLQTWAIINQMHPELVQQYEEALGSATRSPTWDPAFTKELLDPGKYNIGGAWYDPKKLNPNWIPYLVQYGTFSTDFLTQMGDSLLLGERNGIFVDPHTPAAKLIFEALARNPDAAYSYLMGHDPTGQQSTRLQHFLDQGTWYEIPNHEAPPGSVIPNGTWPALGDATFAANMAVSDNPDQQRQILQAIAQVDPLRVPDGFRGTVAQLVAAHIDMLTGDDLHPPPDWAMKLVTIAEIGSDGQVNADRVRQIEEAAAQWMVDNAPKHGFSDKQLTEWLNNVGRLNALVLAGLSEQTRQREEAEKFLEGFMTAVLIVALPVVAVGGAEALGLGAIAATTLEIAEGTAAEAAKQQIMSWLKSEGAAGDLEAYATELAKARTAVTLLLYANDPNHDWMPPDLRNLPLSDPRVQKFLGEVAGAHDTSRLDNDYSGMDQTRLNAMILALDAVDGAFSRQQIGQQVR